MLRGLRERSNQSSKLSVGNGDQHCTNAIAILITKWLPLARVRHSKTSTRLLPKAFINISENNFQLAIKDFIDAPKPTLRLKCSFV